MKLNFRNIEQVARIVTDSNFLEDLDLSWNDLIPAHFTPLLEALSRNRQLKSLNLSWNMLIDQTAQNNPVDFSFRSAMDDYIEERRKAIESSGLATTDQEEDKKI